MTTGDPQYPLGRFKYVRRFTPEEREERIDRIATLPDRLELAVSRFGPEQWDTPYRPGGWTVRQVVHHLPDSHLNAYIRFKNALVEERSVIRPYDEAAWAMLVDSRTTPPEVSLRLLRVLHERWTTLLRGIADSDYDRTLYHPEHDRMFTLDELVGSYAWHGDHHLAHITALAARSGWIGHDE